MKMAIPPEMSVPWGIVSVKMADACTSHGKASTGMPSRVSMTAKEVAGGSFSRGPKRMNVLVPPVPVPVPEVPSAPLGMTKSRMALDGVPLLETEAAVPAAPVVTDPMLMVAAAPGAPVLPVSPFGP
jgi:hypothetical protein